MVSFFLWHFYDNFAGDIKIICYQCLWCLLVFQRSRLHLFSYFRSQFFFTTDMRAQKSMSFHSNDAKSKNLRQRCVRWQSSQVRVEIKGENVQFNTRINNGFMVSFEIWFFSAFASQIFLSLTRLFLMEWHKKVLHISVCQNLCVFCGFLCVHITIDFFFKLAMSYSVRFLHSVN